MPSRNIYKQYLEQAYYHVYNRGVNKERIFHDEQDYRTFISLIERYMGIGTARRGNGTLYEDFSGRLEILAYCLMPNHFHFFVYQQDEAAMREFFKALTVSYSMYFNSRYKRVGPVFQQRYKASHIYSDAYFLHISRYIHLNPRNWKAYKWSSLRDYSGSATTLWVHASRVLEHFPKGSSQYVDFVADYESAHRELENIRHLLADR